MYGAVLARGLMAPAVVAFSLALVPVLPVALAGVLAFKAADAVRGRR